MKSFTIITIIVLFFLTPKIFSQTDGNLVFSVTQVAHTGNWGAKHVLAIWVQDNAGNFVKTKMRYYGGGTNDHLPVWTANSNSNIVDAITGATLSSYGVRTFTWNGKNVSGVTVPNGTYKITLEETWSHGASATVVKSYTFTKGTSQVSLTPANDANFTNVSLIWTPTGSSINEISKNDFLVFPNVISDKFFISFNKITDNATIQLIDLQGKIVYNQKISKIMDGETKTFNPSNLTTGIYILNISLPEKEFQYKVVVN